MLCKLRELHPTDPELKAEFEEMSKSVDAERQIGNATWSEIFEKRVFIRIAIAGNYPALFPIF